MGKADDWFRNNRWDAAEEAAFFGRLLRSKSSYHRAQYARIKASGLEDSADPVRVRAAIALLTRVLKEWPSDSEIACCHWQLARCHLKLGDIDSALDHFQRCIRREDEYPNSLTGAWSDFADLVVSRRLRKYYKQILALLKDHEDRLLFPVDAFILHGCRALIAWESNSKVDAQREAEKALEQAGRLHSGLARHPEVGLVRGHVPLIERLQAIVDDEKTRKERKKIAEPGHLPAQEPEDESDRWEWKLMVQLGELNVKAKEIYDLVNGPPNYDHALPLLVRFLSALPSKPELCGLRKGVIRAISLPGLRRAEGAIDVLMALLQKSDDDEEQWLLTRQIAALAGRKHAGFLVRTALDKRFGTARSYLLAALRKIDPEKTASVVLKILKQPLYLVPGNALEQLAKCKGPSAIPAIRPFLKHDDPDWQKAAQKAIKLIRDQRS